MRRLAVATAAILALLAPAAARASQTVPARQLLAQLTVERERGAGYDRGLFRHWVDADGDGCDARAEVLLAEARVRPGVGAGCRLTGGRWRSPYDGVVVLVARELDVDHMVPLAEAWRSGADRWSTATREAFANDLEYGASLVAVTAGSNRSKSDRDPAAWLPSVDGFRCAYLAQWIAVKWRWGLAVDGVERVALQTGLVGCGAKAHVARPRRASIVDAPAAPEAGVGGGDQAGGDGDAGAGGGAGGGQGEALDQRFRTCRDAIAADLGPYVRGVDPEYEWYRDADRDGVVCER